MNKLATNVLAVIAIFVALGGTAFAGAKLGKDSVNSRSIRDASVTGVDVKDNSLTGDDIDESTLKGGAGNGKLGPDSVGAIEVKDRSLTGTDIQDASLTGDDVNEGSLGEVPAAAQAAQGGTGRYGYTGSCNPELPTFEPCSTTTVTLKEPGRILITGNVEAHIESNNSFLFADGYCRVATTLGPVFNSIAYVRVIKEQQYGSLSVTAVTDVHPAGTYEVGVDCNEAAKDRGIEFPQARVSAVTLSGN